MNTVPAYAEINRFAHALTNWPQQYDQITPGRFDGKLQDVSTGSVRLFRETMNQSVAQHTCTPANTISLLIPLMEHPQCEDARGFAADAITLLPYQSDFFFVGPRHTDYLVIALDTQQLQQQLCPADYHALQSQQQSQRIIGSRHDLPALRRSTTHWLNTLIALNTDRGDDLVDDRIDDQLVKQQKHIEHQLISLTCELFGHHADSSNVHWQPLPGRYRQLVKDCHDLALSPEGSSATLLELSQWLNVPQRTLRYSFEKAAGVSPNQYLRAAKLNAARREIIQSDLPIGSVAANQGFYHGGYFGQQYKAMFGETPRQTRQRRRGISAV